MSYTMNELYIGQSSSVSRTITEADVCLFARATGDFNPAHMDEEYAQSTPFKKRIAHGMLSAGLISAVLGTSLPGKGTIYMGQNMRFLAPVYFNDTVTATVEVKELIPEKNRVILRTYCKNQNEVMVLDGEATVLAPKSKIQ